MQQSIFCLASLLVCKMLPGNVAYNLRHKRFIYTVRAQLYDWLHSQADSWWKLGYWFLKNVHHNNFPKKVLEMISTPWQDFCILSHFISFVCMCNIFSICAFEYHVTVIHNSVGVHLNTMWQLLKTLKRMNSLRLFIPEYLYKYCNIRYNFQETFNVFFSESNELST